MKAIQFPDGYRIELLTRAHARKSFSSGQHQVDEWFSTKAMQHQNKHLSSTKVLIEPLGQIAGYYTLATAQVDFEELPPELTKKMPRRKLPVAVLAWLGLSSEFQGRGLGQRLLAQALHDCCVAGQTFAFVAVILDCVDDAAKSFYQHYNFAELPGHNYRLFLSATQLDALINF